MQYGTSRAGTRKIVASVSLMVATQVIPPTAIYHAQAYEFQPVRYAMPYGMSVKTYAKQWYQIHGATHKQWKCLEQLWTRESHWNYKARNKHGGAYGIPQAYPAKKLAKYGKDWKTNPATQIQWGLDYINNRYDNNACIALRHNIKRGYY